MRKFIILLVIIAIGAGAYFVLRDDGLLEQVTQDRVEQALLANGVPENLALCMSEKMTDRLSISQLRKLERLAAQEGEQALPSDAREALARLRRVDDAETVRVLVSSGASCSISDLRNNIGDRLGL